MRIFVFETNLMWSARLAKSLKALGHEPLVRDGLPTSGEECEAAIVNLGEERIDPAELITKLHEMAIPVIAHAGHKEKDLIELGKAAGADVLATNSQLTFKLGDLIEQVKIPESQ